MKRFYILFLLFLLGCAVTMKPQARQLTNTAQVMLGTTKQEVKTAIGAEVIVGYERSADASATFVPITVKNPVRVESVLNGAKKYEVEYYFTSIKQADGSITDDEMTPMVFENGKLVGKDWEFLKGLKKANP